MKKLMIAALAAGLAGAAYAHDEHAGHNMGKMGGDDKAAATGTQTIKGEIVDLACYMGHDTKGEKHAKCAGQCIAGGAPMGLAAGDSLYVLVNDHKSEKAFAAAKELAGKNAAITGTVSKKGGLQALIVSKAEAAK